MAESEKIPVGIVGASGYGGIQLVRMLLDHPKLTIAYLGGDSSVGQSYAELFPHLHPWIHQSIEAVNLERIADCCPIVFLGLPNGLAYQMVPRLLERGCLVLDLSADYRFQDLITTTTGMVAIAPIQSPLQPQFMDYQSFIANASREQI